MMDDLEVIKKTLVEAIASSHLEDPGDIDEARKSSATRFLLPYHIVFTTHYDLLLYWVAMHAGDPPPFEDCFRSDQDDPDTPYLVFSQRLGGPPRPCFFCMVRCTSIWMMASYANIAGHELGSG